MAPSARKKTAAKPGTSRSGTRKPVSSGADARQGERAASKAQGERTVPSAQRKRGWRDIEAMSERARLKKLLADIWHEDIELEEDIFGESDHLAGYYTDTEDEEEPIEADEGVEYEDFEEDED